MTDQTSCTGNYQVALEAARAHRRLAATLESIGLGSEAAAARAGAERWHKRFLELAMGEIRKEKNEWHRRFLNLVEKQEQEEVGDAKR